MKKMMMTMIFAMLLVAVAKADDDKPIEISRLPQTAQSFIKQHFADVSVAYAKVEEDFMEKSYDVVFTDGSKVEFDRKGEWRDVDCKKRIVPLAIIPANIANYISANHAGLNVAEIGRDRYDYEVKLSNGIELVFNTKGEFMWFD